MNVKISIIDNQAFIQLDGETLTMSEAVLALRSLQTDAAEDLNRAETALVDAERKHGVALADDEEPDRDVLTAVRVDVERARKSVTVIEADLSGVQSEVIAHEPEKMIDAAAQEIEQNTGIRPGLTEAIARRVVLSLDCSSASPRSSTARPRPKWKTSGPASRLSRIGWAR
jgi:hypothetical protein